MKIIIDKISVNYIDEGNGQNILILHGWGANIKSVLPIVNILKNNCRVVALDLPGFGQSESPIKAFDSYDYANFVSRFIDKLKLDNIVLIGHSNGGKICCILSSIYKTYIRKLILIDSTGTRVKRHINYYFKIYWYKIIKKVSIMFSKISKNDDMINNLYKKYGSEDYKNAQGVMRETMVKILNNNIEILLKDISCPTLLIWGDNDTATPLYMAEKMKKLIVDSGLVILKNAGHFSYVDDFGTFKAVIFSFLNNEIKLVKE